MASQGSKNATSEGSSPVLPVDSPSRPAENPVIPATAPVSPPTSGIPTEMVVKLFQFLQPDMDVEQMFAQFMANPVTPQQPEETLPKTQEMEDVAAGVTSGELMAGAITTEEREKEEDARIEEGEVLAVAEVPREERLGSEPETTRASHATEPTREATTVPSQADPQEGETRKRRYHKIVVELSEEEDEDERPQVSLTKRPRTYRPTYSRVVTSPREVPPQEGSPQPPPQARRKGRMTAEFPGKAKKAPGRETPRRSRPLTLARNRVLLDESEDEAGPEGSGRIQPAEEESSERTPAREEGPNYRKISFEVNEAKLKKCTEFADPKEASECAGRVARGRLVKTGRALDQRSLADIRAEQEFVQYITGIGFEWLLEIKRTEIPLVLAQEFFTTFRFQHSAGVLSKSIQFRMFGETQEMSLTEWSVRLGLYSERQAEAGAWLSRDIGQPRDIKEFNCQSTWESITASAPPYSANSSRGTWINHPVLRLAQVFLSYNLLGRVNTSSPISLTELYFMWCMKEQRKVHLGYWLAQTCHMIAVQPGSNLTVCHILGEFLERSVNIFYQGIAPPPVCPSPEAFDIMCFVKAKLVRMVGSRYCFYAIEQNEGPSSLPNKPLTIMDKPMEDKRLWRAHPGIKDWPPRVMW